MISVAPPLATEIPIRRVEPLEAAIVPPPTHDTENHDVVGEEYQIGPANSCSPNAAWVGAVRERGTALDPSVQLTTAEGSDVPHRLDEETRRASSLPDVNPIWCPNQTACVYQSAALGHEFTPRSHQFAARCPNGWQPVMCQPAPRGRLSMERDRYAVEAGDDRPEDSRWTTCIGPNAVQFHFHFHPGRLRYKNPCVVLPSDMTNLHNPAKPQPAPGHQRQSAGTGCPGWPPVRDRSIYHVSVTSDVCHSLVSNDKWDDKGCESSPSPNYPHVL